MKINLSKKEYRALLDILYLADWVMHANEDEPENKNPEHQALRRKLLSYYKEMGAEDCIEYANDLDDYFELREYEDSLQEKYIEIYNGNTFWDELLEQLVQRDLIREIGVREFEALEPEARMKLISEKERYYVNEFEQNGLERLTIKSDNSDLH